MSISQTLQLIEDLSNNIGLPKFYKDDLKLNKSILKKYGGNKYILMLREAGSILFPLNVGANPIFITHYIKEDPTVRFFVIAGLSDTEFHEIDGALASKLVQKPPIIVGSITNANKLISVIESRLSDHNVCTSVFSAPDLETSPSNWEEWHSWFAETGNPVMKSVMGQAIKRLPQLVN